MIRETSNVDTLSMVEKANRGVVLKALKIARTPKTERPKVFNLGREMLVENKVGPNVWKPENQPKRIPLHKQRWFRAMVDRLAYKLENGIITEPKQEFLCDHSNCKHRDSFHVYEFPTPSGHIPKKDAYLFIRAYGGKIICLGE